MMMQCSKCYLAFVLHSLKVLTSSSVEQNTLFTLLSVTIEGKANPYCLEQRLYACTLTFTIQRVHCIIWWIILTQSPSDKRMLLESSRPFSPKICDGQIISRNDPEVILYGMQPYTTAIYFYFGTQCLTHFNMMATRMWTLCHWVYCLWRHV